MQKNSEIGGIKDRRALGYIKSLVHVISSRLLMLCLLMYFICKVLRFQNFPQIDPAYLVPIYRAFFLQLQVKKFSFIDCLRFCIGQFSSFIIIVIIIIIWAVKGLFQASHSSLYVKIRIEGRRQNFVRLCWVKIEQGSSQIYKQNNTANLFH